MPRNITSDDIDAMWAASEAQGLTELDKIILLAFKGSARRLYLERKIRQYLQEMPLETAIGAVWFDGVVAGMAIAERNRLEELGLLLPGGDNAEAV